MIADLQIYENRPARKNVAPGVIVNHRTVTYNAAWNLHIASAHPKTASPPRDATSITGDPDGCADGRETKAGHGTRTRPSDTALPAARETSAVADTTTSPD